MLTTEEIWKPIFGHEEFWEVSSFGRIKTLWGQRKGYIYIGIINSHGYREISTARHKRHIAFRIHVEVAKAFIGPRPAGMQINHRDGNKQNNYAHNLEYVTPRENVHHAMKMGLWKKPTYKKVKDGRVFCIACRKYLEDSLFFRDKKTRHGFHSYCKECHREKRKLLKTSH